LPNVNRNFADVDIRAWVNASFIIRRQHRFSTFLPVPMLSSHSPPPQLPCHPTTFLERGVAMPFTTPVLAGTRARPMARGGIELIVPNPSGRPGVYILPWHDIRDLCHPSLHDHQLSARVSRLDRVTPETIRHAAREVTIEGLAERTSPGIFTPRGVTPGMATPGMATPGMTRAQTDRKRTHFLLLLALVRQMERASMHAVPPEHERPTKLLQRAIQAITRLAPLLDCAPSKIVTSLEQLAGLLAGTGIGRQSPQPRHPGSMATLYRLRDETRVWSQAQESLEHGTEHAAAASLVAAVADLTLTHASAAMHAARSLGDDVVTLLRSWHAAPEAIGQVATRPDWLLDEWEPICRLWRAAETTAGRREALREMTLMVPVIPRAFAAWMGHAFTVDEIPNFRQGVRRNQDWRTGLIVPTPIARDERARLMAEIATLTTPITAAPPHHAG
jgi:hypothetical protein